MWKMEKINENLTGILIPEGLTLPKNYQSGEIIEPSSITLSKRLSAICLEAPVITSGENVADAQNNLFKMVVAHTESCKRLGAVWLYSSGSQYFNYLLFVREEYVKNNRQIPSRELPFSIENIDISLKVYDLSNYDIKSVCEAAKKQLTIENPFC